MVRISNKTIQVQLTRSEIVGDFVLVKASSHELKEKHGWIASGKNMPAAYLIGYLAGKKAKEAGYEYANLDVGLKRVTSGSKIFAVVQGANDAGFEVPFDSDIAPSPEAIRLIRGLRPISRGIWRRNYRRSPALWLDRRGCDPRDFGITISLAPREQPRCR